MSCYVRVIFDILDDDIEFHYIISFYNEDDAKSFKEFMKDKEGFINDKQWLKEYIIGAEQDKPNKVATPDIFEKLYESIKETSSHLEEFRYKSINITNDYFILKEEYINFYNDNYDLFEVQGYNSEVDDYDFDIIDEFEYDKIAANAKKITKELVDELEPFKSTYMFVTQIHRDLYDKNMSLIKKIYRRTAYDKAGDKIKIWRKIFNEDPYKFTSNLIIISEFSKEELDNFNEDLKETSSERMHILDRKYIYSKYTNFLNSLLEKNK